VEPARLKETEFYKLFLYGQAIGPTLHLVVRVQGPDVVHVMLTRRSNSEDYDGAAIEFCRQYASHARQACDISDAGATRRFVQGGLDLAIDDLCVGVAIVEPPATVLHANSTFASLLSATQTPARPTASGVQGFSRFAKAHEARLPRSLVDVLSANPVPSFCNIGTGTETRPISVGIRPLRLPTGRFGSSRSGFVLLARAAESAYEVDEAPLRAAYQLTAAEARVCSGLISGENVHTLSARLGISPQTARTHLKRIYDKTGTTRQAELLRVLMTFAYRKPPARPVEAQRPTLSNVVALRLDRGLAKNE
jgi:DNA-binding CsgD family transcriptional regulator